jgi:hypothetical protein
MTGNEKRKVLVFLGLVMIITMIIATGLSQLELQPGMPLPKLEGNQMVMAPTGEESLVAISVDDFVKILLAIILIVLVLYMTFRLLEGSDWKSIGSSIKIIAVITLVVGSVLFLILLLSEPQNSIPVGPTLPTAAPPATSPLGPAPPLLLWLVGMGVLVSIILLGFWIFGATSNRAKAINLVGIEAEKAWLALKTGLDLKDVIVKCYRQMSMVFEKEQGIERKEFMTTGEFENLLEAAGIPHEPIHQLTQLFEAVRYGNWQSNPGDEQKAIRCLEDLIKYSRLVKRKG